MMQQLAVWIVSYPYFFLRTKAMRWMGFTDAGYGTNRKHNRQEIFLDEMSRVVTLSEIERLIWPVRPMREMSDGHMT